MRNRGYKYFNIYINGIQKLHEHVKNNLNDFKIRMFIDLSIYNDKNIMSILEKLENLELVLYCCDLFVRDKTHHLGVFGTLIRAFPMFDFPNNDADRVIVSDIDFNQKNIETIYGYKYFESIYSKEEFDSFYLMTSRRNRLFKLFNYKEIIINNKYIKPYVLFDAIIGIKKIPTKIITNFIHEQEKNKKTLTTYFVSPQEKIKKCDEYICFGIDEYFLNSILIPYIITNKLPILLDVKFSLIYILVVFMDIYLNLYKKYKNISKINLIKNKINKYVKFLTKDICQSKELSECYKFVLNLFNDKYGKGKISSELTEDVHKIIMKRFMELVYNIAKNEDYSIIPKDFIDICLSKNFVGYFSKRMVIHYNTNFRNNEIEIKNVKIDLTPEEIEKYYSVTDKKRYDLLI
jgi:hypothetical protein